MTMKRLRRLPRKGRTRLPGFEAPPVVRVKLDEPQQLDVWTERLGSEEDAKRIANLADKYPAATLPELVTLDWLQRNNYVFDFQAPVFGGKRAGGSVVDFVVYQGSNALVWYVQGEYWHSQRKMMNRDKAIFLRLIGANISGFRVSSVIELWEDDVYRRRPLVFFQALAGIPLRN